MIYRRPLLRDTDCYFTASGSPLGSRSQRVQSESTATCKCYTIM